MNSDTLTRWLEAFGDLRERWSLRKATLPIWDRMTSACLTAAGLLISAGGATTAKTGSADVYLIANGVLVKVAASTTLPALTGINASAGYFVIAAFFVDSAGTVTVAGGVQGATLGAAQFPQFPTGKALLGFLIITYASAFTGGTTPLDTATTIYVSSTEAFDPYCLIGAL